MDEIVRAVFEILKSFDPSVFLQQFTTIYNNLQQNISNSCFFQRKLDTRSFSIVSKQKILRL